MLLEDFQDLDIALNQNQIESVCHQVEGKCFAGLISCSINHSIGLLTISGSNFLRWSRRWSLLSSSRSQLLLLRSSWVLISQWLQILLAVKEAPKPAWTIIHNASESAPQMERAWHTSHEKYKIWNWDVKICILDAQKGKWNRKLGRFEELLGYDFLKCAHRRAIT